MIDPIDTFRYFDCLSCGFPLSWYSSTHLRALYASNLPDFFTGLDVLNLQKTIASSENLASDLVGCAVYGASGGGSGLDGLSGVTE
jgi:hypothetical protein